MKRRKPNRQDAKNAKCTCLKCGGTLIRHESFACDMLMEFRSSSSSKKAEKDDENERLSSSRAAA